MKKVTKALLIPLNQFDEILIQDREGFKPPRWGYFGGSVEMGESIKEALIRETSEELRIEISSEELIEVGNFTDEIEGNLVTRYVYLLNVDKDNWIFEVNEGKGAKWVDVDEMVSLIQGASGDAGLKIALGIKEYVDKFTSY
jgi:8-oxo-dGTP pyrophosphatase MutT (NUDIX family)